LQRKVVFVGIDSADYTQIKRMCNEDLLPNIKKFSNFFLGGLHAPIPPHTAASWTSMLTGTNPGKHGIFYFKDVQSNKVVSSLDVEAPYIWELIGSQNKRSIVLNVPLTYPVREINGILISGVHANKAEKASVYPESLIPRIENEYKFDLQGVNLFYSFSKDPNAACARLLDDEESRVSLFCELLQENSWDFACIVLTSLDRIQHYAWGLKSETQPLSEFVARTYYRMDQLVGRILETANSFEDCTALLTSDHGFQDKVGAININTILAQAGLLTPKVLTDKFESKITHFGLNTLAPKMPKKIAEFLIRTALRLTPIFPGLLSGSNRFDVPPIDYSRTKAYAYSYGMVTLNIKGRNTYGVVDPAEKQSVMKTVTQALSAAQFSSNPTERLTIIDSMSYYSGSKTDKGPDLLIKPLEDYYFSCNVGPTVVDLKTDGEHSSAAIIGAIGNQIKPNEKIANPQVWDVGASILSLLGFDLPKEIDGKPLFDSERTDSLHQVIVYADTKSHSDLSSAYSKEEEDLIVKRLKDMGYE
jgi:predicted AlkP superfamily phosphohydrolase/phosphomutase